MRIVGNWFVCTDGVARPAILVEVGGGAGLIQEHFLIDSCADSTVLSHSLVAQLQLPTQSPPAGLALKGVSGTSPFVVVATHLELPRDDGGTTIIRGTFAGFTDPAATDLSILGRDVLDLFDVILSRRRDQILLLGGIHAYQIIP
jgi:hypothetical protein